MNKAIALLLLLGALLSTAPSFAKEPLNIETARQNIIRYHDAGAYEEDINKVITQALNYLEWRLTQQATDGKPAIVIDIDETCLSNYRQLLATNFAPMRIGRFHLTNDLPAIAPTLKLFRFAVEHQLPVFIITGRLEKDRTITETNLINTGFTPWNGLTFRNNSDFHSTNASYKTAARKKLTEQGYHIILNISDQQSDLNGGLADKTFKLPNPFYLVK